MANILVCAHREEMLAAMGPFLRGEHRLAILPHLGDVVRSMLLTRVDAVLLDIDAGTMHHIGILPVISRLNSRVPILAVSDPLPLEVEAAVRAAGVFCLLAHPLADGELERRMVTALSWQTAGAWGPEETNDANLAPAVAG